MSVCDFTCERRTMYLNHREQLHIQPQLCLLTSLRNASNRESGLLTHSLTPTTCDILSVYSETFPLRGCVKCLWSVMLLICRIHYLVCVTWDYKLLITQFEIWTKSECTKIPQEVKAVCVRMVFFTHMHVLKHRGMGLSCCKNAYKPSLSFKIKDPIFAPWNSCRKRSHFRWKKVL